LFIPDYVKKVTDRLYAAGESAYLVGGCVRDALMGKMPHDYDIAVSCTPDRTKEIFSDFRTIDTGIKHGTVTVRSDGNNLELTTFRIDGEYGDNRHPKSVCFTRNIRDDLARRDFTVNAIAYSERDGIVDPFGGENDIKNKIIRCVGDPDRRFNEDGLRIMRGIRFSSVLGFAVEENTADSMIKNAELLYNISSERIFVELKKLLVGKDASRVLVRFSSVIKTVFPSLDALTDEQYNTVCNSIKNISSPDVAFAALFIKNSRDDTGDALSFLKSDNKFRDTVLLLHETANCYDDKTKEYGEMCFLRLFAGCHGIENTEKLNTLIGITRSENAVLSDFVKNGCPGAMANSRLAVTGADLIKTGLKGAEIGKALNALTVMVAAGKIENSKEKLLEQLAISN
jgi:tRNA nucleotidyltransferase (CCA-adding enzyme)